MYRRGSIDIDGNRLKPIVKYSPDFQCIKCGKSGKIVKGFCKTHYNQFRKGLIDYDGNQLNEPKRVQRYTDLDFCKLKCGRRPRIRGFCPACFDKIQRGSIDETGKRLEPPTWKNVGKTCRSADCDKPAHCRGYCVLHYSRSRAKPRVLINVGKPCKALACSQPAYCRGYCTKHYGRWKAKNLKPVAGVAADGRETRLPGPELPRLPKADSSGRDVDDAQSNIS